jgi:hypothetical protein
MILRVLEEAADQLSLPRTVAMFQLTSDRSAILSEGRFHGTNLACPDGMS